MKMGPKIHPGCSCGKTNNAGMKKNKDMKDHLLEKEIYLMKPSICGDNQ